MFTAHATTWHRRDQDATTYYQYCAENRRVGALDQRFGPWEYQDDGTNRTGDADPDTEWSSGGLPNWLREAEIPLALIGKYDHGYGNPQDTPHRAYASSNGPLGNPLAVERVPADFAYWSAHVGDDTTWNGGAPNLWRHKKAIKHETNTSNIGPDFLAGTGPANGSKPTWLGGSLDDECAPDGWCDEVEYRQYDLAIAAGSASNALGTWHASITLPTGHKVEVGDLIVVEATPSGYAMTPPTASPSPGVAGTAGTEAVAVAVAGNVVTYELETNANPGTFIAGICYPKRNYATWSDTFDFLDWVATKDLNDQWVCWLAFSAPHPNISDGTEQERIYEGTVDSDDFYMLDGVPGAYSSLVDSGHAAFAQAKTQWAQKMAVCRSVDDALDAIFTNLEDSGMIERTAVIVLADQGVMYGERGFYTNGAGDYFVKRLAFEGVRSPCWMFHPHLPGLEVNQPTYCADICCTLLDLMGLDDHFAHTKREGYSLLRVIADNDYPDRAVWVFHDPKDQPGVDCLVDENGMKWIAQSDPTSPGAGYVQFLFDLEADPGELVNLAPTWSGSPSLAAFAARAAALELAQGEDRRTT